MASNVAQAVDMYMQTCFKHTQHNTIVLCKGLINTICCETD